MVRKTTWVGMLFLSLVAAAGIWSCADNQRPAPQPAAASQSTDRLPSGVFDASASGVPAPANAAPSQTSGAAPARATAKAAPAVPPGPPPTLADTWRKQMDLDGAGWKLWRDKRAQWRRDRIYPQVTAVSLLPVNPPTVGWDALYAAGNGAPAPTTAPGAATIDPKDVKAVTVPGTVEEYFWGADGDPYDTNGNYQGVSWWWRDLAIPADWTGKRLVLKFNACRLRAEVFVNNQLVGYDVIGNIPFEVDITKAAKVGQVNKLAVRITDPNNNDPDNNFDYADHRTMAWGDTSVRIPPSHGFGGISGRLALVGLDALDVSDIYVRNMPSPTPDKPTDVSVETEINNPANHAVTATLRIHIFEKGHPEKTLFQQEWPHENIVAGTSTIVRPISAPDAKIWDLDTPNLYQCEVSVESDATPATQIEPATPAARDALKVTFGYRWFAPEGIGTETPTLRLNGRKIMVRASISWGYWPITGLFPSEELAERQIKLAKTLGFNMLCNHRCIADPLLLEKADELGLLLYDEPGGYKCDRGDDTSRRMATEKLMRWIKRERSHPSIVIYDMINEIWVRENVVRPEYLRDMVAAHKLDPSRTIVLTSGEGGVGGNADPRGSWMPPYGMTRLEYGWSDEHHAGGPGVYSDGLYNNSQDYYAGYGPQKVIFVQGEEGSIPTPPIIDTMLKQYAAAGKMGWDGEDYARLSKNFNEWLDAHHARNAFKTLDDLCHSMGNIANYHHGRVIESVRAGDKVNMYVVNGWDDSKMDNHSGIVDPWRDGKGDPAILAYYNQPLYIAVKLPHTVEEPGGRATADLAIINEKNVHGPHTLELTVTDPNGEQLYKHQWPVNITGGEHYGQFLQEKISFSVGNNNGYIHLAAQLFDPDQKVVATGKDVLFVVDYKHVKIPDGGAVLDVTGTVRRFLEKIDYTAVNYTDLKGPAPFIVAADRPFTLTVSKNMDDILERVKRDGTTLVVMNHAEDWAGLLKGKGIIQYDGEMMVRSDWLGGQYFVLNDPLFTDLPQSQGMNWEYQVVSGRYQPDPGRRGLLLIGDEAAAGAYSSTDTHLATVVGSVRYGRGKILFSTLPIFPNLSNSDPTMAVAKRIFVNFLAYNGSTVAGAPSSETAPRPPLKLVIKKAVYGDLPDGKSIDVTNIVSQLVVDGTLSVEAANDKFTDPAEGITKKLKVDYTFNGAPKTKTVNENETLTITASGD